MYINKITVLGLFVFCSCASINDNSKNTEPSYTFTGKVVQKATGLPCIGFQLELRDSAYKAPLFNFEKSAPILAKAIVDKEGLFKMECTTFKDTYHFLVRDVGQSSMVFKPISVTEINLIYYNTDPANETMKQKFLDDAAKQKHGK